MKGHSVKLAVTLVVFLLNLKGFCSEIYSVKISTSSLVNTIDERFLSFTVDPEVVAEFGRSDETLSMASALSPAYIRLAGPSTAHLTLQNSSLIINNTVHQKESLQINDERWHEFLNWSKSNGFDLVLGLNHEERLESGLWDPNSVIRILSEMVNVDFQGLVWQLGYECSNQSIVEYMNDLETLRIISETVPGGLSKGWKVVSGDITPCLNPQYGDFRDYVYLSIEMLDAVFMDGNSSAHELDHMHPSEKLRLLQTLSKSSTPLWLNDKRVQALENAPESESLASELRSAADWIYSLGHSAKNGFAVHFKELSEKDIVEPSLSFYMALLFKNLVGDRVLDVSIDALTERASLFAHCTSLRHKAVPGAITLYGANLDDEPARFSLKLSKKEEGGDILQFILGLDDKKNILVNGMPLYSEGDIRPIVKRVRPYRTLIINLPPKSFGFWVLANTKVDACYDDKPNEENQLITAEVVSGDLNTLRTKRDADIVNAMLNPDELDTIELTVSSLNDGYTRIDTSDSFSQEDTSAKTLAERIENLNKNLDDVHKVLEANKNLARNKRQTHNEERKKWKLHSIISKNKIEDRIKNGISPKLAERISQLTSRFNTSRIKLRFPKNKVIKRFTIENPKKVSKKNVEVRRNKRSVEEENWSANEIYNENDKYKYGKLLHKYNKIINAKELSDSEEVENVMVLNTKFNDDNAEIKLTENLTNGILRKTVESFISVLEDFNDKMNKLMSAVSMR